MTVVLVAAFAALAGACSTRNLYALADVSGSSATASRTLLPADGNSAAWITLQVRQHNGVPIANVPVKVMGQLVSVLPSQTATDANGTVRVAVTSTFSGTYAITAALLLGRQQLPLPIDLPLTFVAPNTAVAFAVAALPSFNTTTAGVATALTVRALDANGAVATGYTGTLHFTSSDAQAMLPADVTLTGSDAGAYQNATSLRLFSAGLQSVHVSDGVLQGSLTHLLVQPAAAVGLQCSGDANATAGVATFWVVTALDTFGNVASGYRGTLTFASDDVQAELPPPYIFLPGNAGISAPVAATLKTAGTIQSQVHDTNSLTATCVTQVWAAAASPNTTTLQCAPTLPADGAPHGAVQVQTRDAFGNPVAHVPVSLEISGLAAALSPTSAVTDDLGALTVELVSTVPQQSQVRANIGGSPATCSSTLTRVPCFAFATALQASVGHSPQAMAVGDVNRDGRLDAVVANGADNSLTLLLNQGAHVFASSTVPLSAAPLALRLGDVNREGRLDLLVATQDGMLTTLAQQANQAFVPLSSRLLPGNASDVLLGDWNRDGNLDAAAAIPSTAQVAVLLGSAAGTLSAATLYAVGPAPQALAAADLNNDGLLDLLSSSASEGAVSLLLGGAAGTFAPRTALPAGLGGRGLGVADMDRDGRLDVVVANQNDNTVAVLRNLGGGSFAAPSSTAVTAPQALVLADLDGDGQADVVVSSPSSGTVWVLGNAAGTLAPPVAVRPGGTPTAVAVGDFERNGRQSLAALQPASDQWLLLANACTPRAVCSTFSAAAPTLYSHSNGEYIDSADVNGDGRPDIITSGGSGALFLNQGGGLLSAASALSGGGGRGLVPADFNRDGKPDIAFAHVGSGVTVMLNSGTGSFPSASNYTGGTPFRISAADLDGDGDLDLVTSDQSVNNLYLFINNGSGVFTNGAALAMPARPVSIAVDDMNGDGTADLVPTLADNRVMILTNLGNATFSAGTSYPTGQIAGYENAVLADVNRDGQPDLLQVSNFNAEVEVLINTGGALAPYVAYRTNQYPYGMKAADLNGDGYPDMAVANYAPQTLTVLLNAGDGTFSPMVTLLTPGEQNDAVIVDLDGDGRPDVVGADDASGGPVTLLGTCP